MTIFDTLNNILTYKPKNAIQEDDDNYIPFMINRWCSFHSPLVAQIINISSNKYYTCFLDNKQRHYNLLTSIIPKYKKTFIKYIKKANTKEDNNKDSLFLAQQYEISSREVDLCKSLFNINVPKYECNKRS